MRSIQGARRLTQVGSTLKVLVAALALLTLATSCEGSEKAASGTSGKMPAVTCVALDKAEEQIKSAGFTDSPKLQDRQSDRHVIVASNWIVVDQNPTADKEVQADDTITLGVLKTEEASCSPTQTPSTQPAAPDAPTSAAAAPATSAAQTTTTRLQPTTTTAARQSATTTSTTDNPTNDNYPADSDEATGRDSGTQGAVTPGAFCSSEGAEGRTVKGTLMRCTSKEGDTRLRWRAA